MTLAEIKRLSEQEKAELILSLWQELQRLKARMAEVEARNAELEDKLKEPPKDSRTSSLPPSQSRKANKPAEASGTPKGRREASVGRPGGGRALHPNPDQFIVAKACACPHCGARLPEETQGIHAVYDKIELPPIKPVVTRVTQ